jgi:hypothetical protein
MFDVKIRPNPMNPAASALPAVTLSNNKSRTAFPATVFIPPS